MKTNGKHGLRDSVISLPNKSDASRLQPSTAFHSLGKVAEPSKTLLVVDADPAVRQLEAEILSRQGYNVLQAQGAEEALRLAHEADVIHLLITDFSLPQVDGLELSHQFRSIHPQTPMLLISGSLSLLRDGTRDLEHAVLLAKPFAWNELLDKVRRLLDAAFIIRIRKPWAHD